MRIIEMTVQNVITISNHGINYLYPKDTKIKQEEKSMYTPKPINTDSITLNDDMLALSEQLAENVHDIWALGRMSEGWTYGEQRDDELKQSPCLIPYSDLPESEKEYDRNTALATIKAIVALGYKIEK